MGEIEETVEIDSSMPKKPIGILVFLLLPGSIRIMFYMNLKRSKKRY